ncbi:MAG: hypothetical protein ACRECN_07140, partial [Methylocella sp.]
FRTAQPKKPRCPAMLHGAEDFATKILSRNWRALFTQVKVSACALASALSTVTESQRIPKEASL